MRIISDVNGYIPLNGVCNWYDSAGQINQQKIRTIMEKENCNVCITGMSLVSRLLDFQ